MEIKIRAYVENLFRNVPNSNEAISLKEEMIQNLTEKYHDLLLSGNDEESAYNITVASIGDVSELINSLNGTNCQTRAQGENSNYKNDDYNEKQANRNAIITMVAVVIYVCLILSIFFSHFRGITFLMFVLAAAATCVLIYNHFEQKERGSSAFSTGETNNRNCPNSPVNIMPSQINALKIKWVSGKVNVVKCDCQAVTFSEKSSRVLAEYEKMSYSIENGALKISAFKFNIDICNIRLVSKDLTVYVPKDLLEVNIDNVSSRVEITNLNAKKYDIKTVSGNVYVNDANVQEMKYNTVSGRISINGAFNTISGNSISGTSEIVSKVCPNNVKSNSISGVISLFIPENDGFTVTKSSISGTISSDFNGSMSKDTFIYKNGINKFRIEGVSGNININMLK